MADDVLAYMRLRKGRGPRECNRESGIRCESAAFSKKQNAGIGSPGRGKALEDDAQHQAGAAYRTGEKLKLLRTAGMRPEWQNAYYGALLVFNTTCRGCELRGLQWRDVDMLNPAITIRHSKTDAGLRLIPLNEGGQSVIRELYARSRKLGEVKPA